MTASNAFNRSPRTDFSVRRRRLIGGTLPAAAAIAAAWTTVPAAQAQTYALSTIATFTGAANGANPVAGLTIDIGGNLYGTTYGGGSSGEGTVFKIAAGTNSLTTLVTFTGIANGRWPQSNLYRDSGGNLYGTNYRGGANNMGTVFKIAAGTNALTTLANFAGAANGQNPFGGLTQDSSGNLYGTTSAGGASNLGTVFKIAAGTNTLTTLVTFTGTANGATPYAGLTIDGGGNLYGTTSEGGASNKGTIFKIAAGTNAFSTLTTFTGTANGASPYAVLILDSNGNLYGTTYQGGASNRGTVFKIAAGTNTLTTLATFTGPNGQSPFGPVTLDASGNLYGTTFYGGANGPGSVFKIAAGTSALTTIASFDNAAGANPQGSLVVDGGGNVYGATYQGASGKGTIFKLTPGRIPSRPTNPKIVLPVLK